MRNKDILRTAKVLFKKMKKKKETWKMYGYKTRYIWNDHASQLRNACSLLLQSIPSNVYSWELQRGSAFRLHF